MKTYLSFLILTFFGNHSSLFCSTLLCATLLYSTLLLSHFLYSTLLCSAPLPSPLLLGTPYYVAPEVLRREYNEECDIWSIGVITYILLCGYPPFYGDNDTEIFQCVRIGKFDFPSPEWDDISDTAKDFVCFLLQSNAHLRPTALEAMEHSWITMNADPKEKDNTNKIVMLSQSARGNVYQKYLGMQKLKKATLVTIAKNLTHEQVGKLEDIFQRVEDTKNRISLMDFHDSIIQGKDREQNYFLFFLKRRIFSAIAFQTLISNEE